MSKVVIGLAGRAGSGKSTCAKFLVQEYGAEEFSLAAPLKLLAVDLFGFTHRQVFGGQADKEAIDPRYGFSARQALIKLGNGARERLGENVWLRACLEDIARSSCEMAVVSDVRYPNEAAAVAERGFVIRLRCPDAATAVDPNAPSERSVDEIPGELIAAEIDAPRSPGAYLLIEALRQTLRDILKVAA